MYPVIGDICIDIFAYDTNQWGWERSQDHGTILKCSRPPCNENSLCMEVCLLSQLIKIPALNFFNSQHLTSPGWPDRIIQEILNIELTRGLFTHIHYFEPQFFFWYIRHLIENLKKESKGIKFRKKIKLGLTFSPNFKKRSSLIKVE